MFQQPINYGSINSYPFQMNNQQPFIQYQTPGYGTYGLQTPGYNPQQPGYGPNGTQTQVYNSQTPRWKDHRDDIIQLPCTRGD